MLALLYVDAREKSLYLRTYLNIILSLKSTGNTAFKPSAFLSNGDNGEFRRLSLLLLLSVSLAGRENHGDAHH
jgi:hypothetical protein